MEQRGGAASRRWLWIGIAIAVVVVGVIAYFALYGGSSSGSGGGGGGGGYVFVAASLTHVRRLVAQIRERLHNAGGSSTATDERRESFGQPARHVRLPSLFWSGAQGGDHAHAGLGSEADAAIIRPAH